MRISCRTCLKPPRPTASFIHSATASRYSPFWEKLPYSAIKWASPPSSSETLPHRDPRARRSSPAPAKTISLTTPFICQAAGLLILKKAHAILPPTILSGCWNMQMNICPHWIPTLILMTASGTDMPPCMPTKALCCSYPTSTIMRIYTPLSMRISASLPPLWDFPLEAA